MSKRIYSLGWSAVENAQTYRVFRSLTEVGNKQELVLTSKRSLELNQYIPGSSDYYYFIKAQATGYQDSDYSTPLRWKTFSISRSVDTGVIETTDDSFVGEGFGYNTGFVAPDGKIFNRAVCLLTIGGIQHPEYISFLTGDKAFNIDIPAEAVTGDIVYSAVVQDEITQLTTPTIAINADGKTLEITDVANATSYDVYVDGTMKTNVASVPNTTTLDLSTLSDIADGAHTVKVKAKASGYNDSEFSNEVSYTKAPAGYKLTIMGSYFESGLPAGIYSMLSFEGLDSSGYPEYPRYITTAANEAYVEYKSTQSSTAIRKACPLVFENVSKIYLHSGPIEINGTRSDDYPSEYALTQDTTIKLGYRED